MSVKQNSRYSQSITSPLHKLDFKNQNFDLTYIYPTLCDNKMSNYHNLIRDFLSAQIIKELFISNTINVINQVSGYQLKDESDNGVTVNIGNNGQNYNQYQVNQFELQKMLSSHIKRLLGLIKNDPTFNEFRPSVDLINLENQSFVPVIVGTKPYTINNFGLSMFLLAGLTNNISLTNYSNVSKIYQEIKKVNPKNFESFIDIITTPKTENFIKDNLTNATRQRTRKNDKNKLTIFDDNIDSNMVYKNFRSSIDGAYYYLKKVNNQKDVYNDCGLDLTNQQMVDDLNSFSVEIQEIFNHIRYGFNKDLSDHGNRLFISMIDLVTDMDSQINFNMYAKELVSELSDDIFSSISGEFLKIVNDTFSDNDKVDEKSKKLKIICNNIKSLQIDVNNITNNIKSSCPKIFNDPDQLMYFL
jgi:hypothetical protein